MNNFKSLKLDVTIYLGRRTNKKRGVMSSSIKLANANKWLLIIIFTPIISVSFTSFIFNLGQTTAFAQESAQQQGQGSTGGSPPEELIIRRVEIWGVFYRLMVVAFVVGAVVQGVIIYVCWRFRESHKKNMPREQLGGMHR
jgi:nicotinamide riboside transporter PnuC